MCREKGKLDNLESYTEACFELLGEDEMVTTDRRRCRKITQKQFHSLSELNLWLAS